MIKFWIFNNTVFILIIIYTLLYKYIDKYFNLNSGYKLNKYDFIKIVFYSLIPIINVLAFISAIYEDILLYKQNNKKRK